MSKDSNVIYQTDGGVATVKMNNPESRNAQSPRGYELLTEAFKKAETDENIDLVILTGTDGYFSAGGNLNTVADGHLSVSPKAAALEYVDSWSRCWKQMEMMSKTIVAAIQGPAYAGGLALVLATDLSIASRSSVLRFPEALRGLIDPFANVRLPQRVGWARAKSLLLACQGVSADEAKEIGLINEVVDDDDFEDGVARYVAKVRLSSPYARALYKDGLNRALTQYDARLHLASITSPDAPEGVAAFLEKREPRWSVN